MEVEVVVPNLGVNTLFVHLLLSLLKQVVQGLGEPIFFNFLLAQQVYYVDAAISSQQVVKVLFEGQLVQVALLELDLSLRLGLLGPEEGHRAASLQVGEKRLTVVEIYDDLRFYKVRNASVLVDAAGVETRAGPGCVSP